MFDPSFSVDKLIWPAECIQLEQLFPQALRDVIVTIEKELKTNKTVIGFCSDKPGTGCTDVMLLLARALARGDKKILLLDARFSRPQLAQKLRLAPEFGWNDAVNHIAPLEDTVIESIEDKLDIAPLKEPISNPDSLDMAPIIRKLKNAYDVILVDIGTEPTDNIWWLDGAILVRDARTVNKPVIALNLPNINVIGQIENFVQD